MANLPQVLDQNYIMGAHISDPTLLVLQVRELFIDKFFLAPLCDVMLFKIFIYLFI